MNPVIRFSPVLIAGALMFMAQISLARVPEGADSMEHSLKPPYLNKVGARGSITIWIVDGTYVRTHMDEEFTNYGQHFAFRFIPENEFWIDR